MYCYDCQRHHHGTCETLLEEVELTAESRVNRGYGMGGPSLGIDVTDGDLVENLGNGLGIDLATGGLELNIGGFDIPL